MKYGKRDGNHTEIREALRRVPGCRVFDSGDVGGGFPDLVIGFMGIIRLLEVKDGSLPPSQRKLTKDERKFHSAWEHLPVHVVNSVDEAYRVIGLDTGPIPF
jgi:hypothetical protein